jgi:hypothetical protein
MSAEPLLTSDVIGLTKVAPLSRRGSFLIQHNRAGTDIRTRLAFMRDARGGSGSSRGQDRGPQITLPCRMSLTSSGEQPSHSP